MFSPTLVHDFLTRSARLFPKKTAVVCGDERWTYGAMDRTSSDLAAVLSDRGVNRQDRVVIMADNSPQTIIALYGVLKAGAIFVILDGTLKAPRLGRILNDCGAAAVISHTDKAGVVQEALTGYDRPCPVLWYGNAAAIPAGLEGRSLFWHEALGKSGGPHRAPRGAEEARRCIDVDLAALIYTSGSSGEPKGVMSCHLNMVSAARSIIQYLENTPRDIILNVLPLSFDYGLYQVVMSVMFGGTVVLEPSFSYPAGILKRIAEERVTGFPLVPTIAALLLRMRNLHDHNLASLRYVTNTAAALPVEHIRRLRALLPHARIYSMYGLTECKRVSYLPPEELDRRPASVGKPVPNSEVFIVDDDGREVGTGQVGELVVRGANVMCGYWNAPELTSRVFRQGAVPGDRMLHTGDLFTRDSDGFLFFVGRKDDMIKTKGERVSPREVENVLCGLEGVAEAAVIGEPDEILGQSIKALIVAAAGARLTVRDVLRHCSRNLENFKVPKHVEFVKALSKTPNGKIDKRGLRRRPPEASWNHPPPAGLAP